MKKLYSAPDILFESFTMSTNIAGQCEGEPVNNPTQGTCAVLGTGGIAIFNDTVGAVCVFKPTDLGAGKDDEWDGLCYYNPTDYNNLFNS